ncbi:MAG: RDD family protein [Candidatus Melainabacteria bacterium]|nr:RDD family protein [Candidatus Melainabacteria bacterium]
MTVRPARTLATQNPLVIAGMDATPITVERAGIGYRLTAYFLDLIIIGLLVGLTGLACRKVADNYPEVGSTVYILISSMPFVIYPWLLEWLWNGQTLGKRVVSIRVVRDNGQPIGFWEAAGRNLMRILDVMFFGVGLLAMMASPSEKRLGDLLSGTQVVYEGPLDPMPASMAKALEPHTNALPQQSPRRSQPQEPPSQNTSLWQWLGRFGKKQSTSNKPATAPDTPEALARQQWIESTIGRLPLKDYYLLSLFLARRKRLSRKARQRLAQALAQRIAQQLLMPDELSHAVEAEPLIEHCYRTYREHLDKNQSRYIAQ